MRNLRHASRTCIIMGLLSAAACTDPEMPPPEPLQEIVENRTSLGEGHVESFVTLGPDGTLRALGVRLDEAAVQTLPTLKNDGNTCWDQNGDGTTDRDTECSGGHERVLFFPKIKDVHFKWIMLNWQAHGHAPAHIFDKPHFDLHYFMQDYIERNFIRTGPCGTQVNCDDFNKAMIDAPAPFFPVGFENLGGVAGRMGNHLVDRKGVPFNGEPLTQAFAYGQYNGHLTYFEPLVEGAWLKSQPDACSPIKAPPAMEISGYYPKQYCTRYRPQRQEYVMTMEDWEYRQAPQQP